MKNLLLLSIFIFLTVIDAKSQCTKCSAQCNNSGTYASTLGDSTVATLNACFASGYRSLAIANYATAIGWRSKASGQYSTAFGFRAYSEATKSISMGSLVKVTSFADRAIAIGCGGEEGSNYYLVNGIPRSMMIGFTSIYPTFFISESTPSANYDKTGKVAIGNVTTPISERAKLQIKADAGEAANLFVEPNSWSAGSSAVVQIGNQYHGLIGSYDRGLEFKTQKNYVFNDGNLGIGTTNPIHLFQVAFNGSQFYLDNNTLTFEAQGGGNCPTIKLISSLRNTWNIKHDFTTSSLQFRYNDAITGLTLMTDGTVGIGTLNTGGYKLAVYGKIRTQEVMVEHPDQWYDFVFEDDYPLLDIDELKEFIENNNRLPQIPSDDEVQQNGIELARMNGLLLQKIEEMTLYIINQEERINALEEKMKVNESQTIER